MNLAPERGAGPLSAPLWLVGRDYGAEEAARRAPFVGQAGHVLDAALRAAGLARIDVRIDNLVPVQPPANDFARHRPEDVAWGAQRLAALLDTHRPRVIIAFGAEVSRFLVGDAWPDDGIQALRGYLWDTRFGRVLTSVHPAAMLREWTPWRALLDVDLRRAKAEVEAGAPPLTTREVTVVTHEHELHELQAAIATTRPQGGTRFPFDGVNWLSVDIENTHDLQLACVGFAPTPERAWVIPAHAPWQLDAICALCESPTPKVLQNGQYDRFFLKRFAGVALRAQVFDTQLAWHALNPELAGKKAQVGYRKAGGRRTAKSLKFLASIYLRVPHWKAYDFASEDEQYTLCGRDCCNTLAIALKQRAQLDAA